MPSRPTIVPPVGKSGPGIAAAARGRAPLRGAVRRSMTASTPSITSRMLCGGMLVAMPTAMPVDPLTSRFGNGVGRTVGSSVVSSKFGRKSTVSLSRSAIIASASDVEPRFGVAVGRRRIAVDRSEVALPVDERVAHVEVLREPDERVVRRRVAVRMVVADDFADDLRALAVRPIRREAHLPHREQHAPVRRLQAVADVGQRAPDDYAHRVIHVRALHLVFDVDRDSGRGCLDPCLVVWGSRGFLAVP